MDRRVSWRELQSSSTTAAAASGGGRGDEVKTTVERIRADIRSAGIRWTSEPDSQSLNRGTTWLECDAATRFPSSVHCSLALRSMATKEVADLSPACVHSQYSAGTNGRRRTRQPTSSVCHLLCTWSLITGYHEFNCSTCRSLRFSPTSGSCRRPNGGVLRSVVYIV